MAKKKKQREKFDSDRSSPEDEDARLFREAIETLDERQLRNKLSAERQQSNQLPAKKPKSKSNSLIRIDLHGMRLEEAIRSSCRRLDQLMSEGDRSTVEIITGKGRHSDESGGVLVKEVYGRLKKRYSNEFVFLDSDPGKDLLGGLPIRGSFRMRLR
ncbi:Smr/MutS family protein [Oligoflexaceae bacterium]|nr:Smr/MutS family protein [Oligoflexaceae bacterium]